VYNVIHMGNDLVNQTVTLVDGEPRDRALQDSGVIWRYSTDCESVTDSAFRLCDHADRRASFIVRRI
jgi:hypothetical protein